MLSVADDAPRSFTLENDIPHPKRQDDGTVDESNLSDTASLNVMDAEGNMFSMTESDGHMVSPLIPGWGFGLGARMSQFNLDPTLANVMAPHKRPRNTNSPVLIMKDGLPLMGLSTPGSDQQLQALLTRASLDFQNLL